MAPDLLSVGWKILGMEAGIITGKKGKRGRETGRHGDTETRRRGDTEHGDAALQRLSFA